MMKNCQYNHCGLELIKRPLKTLFCIRISRIHRNLNLSVVIYINIINTPLNYQSKFK